MTSPFRSPSMATNQADFFMLRTLLALHLTSVVSSSYFATARTSVHASLPKSEYVLSLSPFHLFPSRFPISHPTSYTSSSMQIGRDRTAANCRLRPICSSAPLGAQSERSTSYKASLLNHDARVIKLGWTGYDWGMRFAPMKQFRTAKQHD